MARYHSEFQFRMDPKPVFEQIHQYLMSEGYDYREYRGELVYKKGVGIAQGPTFLKIMAGNGMIVVEAWIKWTLVPGVYFGELGLTGMMGAIPKSILKTRVQYVEYLVMQAGGVGRVQAVAAQPQMQTYMPIQPQVQQPQVQQPQVQQAAPVQNTAPVPNTTPAFCSQCGNRLAPGSKFCNQCGTKIQ